MASTIAALDTPQDVSLSTTTLQVNLPVNCRLWSISCSADVLSGTVQALMEAP